MKKFYRTLKMILIVVTIISVVVFVLRYINGKITAKKEQIITGYYSDPVYHEVNKNNPANSKIPGVDITEVKGDYINGYHLTPQNITHKGVVVTFGGSEGSSNIWKVAFIAKQGYEVYSMYYFGRDNQKKELVEVPLDFFMELFEEVEKHAKIPRPLTLLGGSKGAELSLLLSSKYPDKIDNVVLYAPSSYVFQGLSFKDSTPHSSWSFRGEEVPFLSFMETSKLAYAKFLLDMLINKPYEYGHIYNSIVENTNTLTEATIDMSRVRANILMFAGKDDRMWPSVIMAQKIQTSYKGQCDLIIYDKTGHLFFGPQIVENVVVGGEYEDNVKAEINSNKILIEKLEKWSQ